MAHTYLPTCPLTPPPPKVVAEWNPIAFAIIVTMLIAPPLVARKILSPCWNCYDFEAATLHEIGHFLGLGHPDNLPDNFASDLGFAAAQGPGNNSFSTLLAYGGRVNASNCEHTWDYVQPGVPTGAELDPNRPAGAYPVRDAIMEAFTQHNPKVCLTDDDVEALGTLYPDCSATSISQAVCYKRHLNIGAVRIITYVLLPMLTALIAILILSGVMAKYQRSQTFTARTKVRAQERDMRETGERHERDIRRHQVGIKWAGAAARARAKVRAQFSASLSV